MPDAERPDCGHAEELDRLRARVAELEGLVKRLLSRIDELERGGKRQAAPFSKGPPKSDPKKPGRKPGSEHGSHFSRALPEQIDEKIDVPLPHVCPDCGGRVVEVEVADQFQTDLPRVKPITRRFRIHIGACRRCGQRVQPRHPLQTSDALGAASVQLGPEVLSLGALLAKSFALPWRKAASFIARAFSLVVGASALCRASLRLATRLEPTYYTLVRGVATSPVAYADETGWKTGGHRRWLWVFTTLRVTVYKIAASRGGDVVAAVLGSPAEFKGILGRDGWAPYRDYERAQSCLFHHMHRCRDLIEVADRGEARLPRALQCVFKAALALRDRREELTPHGFASLRGKIEAALDWLLAWKPSFEPNARFLKHLRNERPHLLTFLYEPEVEATNWPAEQAIRPAVLARKISGGTRTDRGSDAHSILTSVLRTAALQARDALALLVATFRASRPLVLDLVPDG